MLKNFVYNSLSETKNLLKNESQKELEVYQQDDVEVEQTKLSKIDKE